MSDSGAVCRAALFDLGLLELGEWQAEAWESGGTLAPGPSARIVLHKDSGISNRLLEPVT